MTTPASHRAAAATEGHLIPAPRDDLCLDFANTRYWRGSDPATETLNGLGDLLDWAAASGGFDLAVVEAMRRWWGERADDAAVAFSEAIRLREAVFRVFRALADGVSAPADDLETLNLALARAPARSRLERTDGRFAWRVEEAQPSAAALLAPVLWSAGDLLTGTRLGRVRHCSNDRCLWLFLDDSKSANRRWCSMSACGNRAKVRRHYERHRHG